MGLNMGFASGVYELRNTTSGKQYIGSSVNMPARWGAHRNDLRAGRHCNAHLQASWDAHGEAAFQFRPLMLCAPDALREWEQRYINDFTPEFNLARDVVAPMLGRRHLVSTKEKMSLALRGNTRALGRMFSPEHKERIAEFHRGRKRSAETCARISAAKKGKPVARRGPMPMAQRLAISVAKRSARVTRLARG